MLWDPPDSISTNDSNARLLVRVGQEVWMSTICISTLPQPAATRRKCCGPSLFAEWSRSNPAGTKFANVAGLVTCRRHLQRGALGGRTGSTSGRNFISLAAPARQGCHRLLKCCCRWCRSRPRLPFENWSCGPVRHTCSQCQCTASARWCCNCRRTILRNRSASEPRRSFPD